MADDSKTWLKAHHKVVAQKVVALMGTMFTREETAMVTTAMAMTEALLEFLTEMRAKQPAMTDAIFAFVNVRSDEIMRDEYELYAKETEDAGSDDDDSSDDDSDE